jgi:hypothetical protein
MSLTLFLHTTSRKKYGLMHHAGWKFLSAISQTVYSSKTLKISKKRGKATPVTSGEGP